MEERVTKATEEAQEDLRATLNACGKRDAFGGNMFFFLGGKETELEFGLRRSVAPPSRPPSHEYERRSHQAMENQ